ncbi:MAG TPA: hypothetical protein DCE42_17170, partial [Myxococcales bacterium]|nr:hypothetical protein [Myxococcales bacterium]
MFDIVVLVLLGSFIGFTGGYAGIGGAPFLVAGLVLVAGVDQHTAQGTILAVMLGPMSLTGVMVMWDRVKLLLTEIIIGVLAYAICSNLGARLAYAMPTHILEVCFGVLLIGLGFSYLNRNATKGHAAKLDPAKPTVKPSALLAFNLWNVAVLSCLIGVFGGLFGIGAGVLMVPILISLFGVHKDDARSLSLAVLLPPVSIGAVIEYQSRGNIDWKISAIIFVLYFATNYSGARMGRSHDTSMFMKVMGGILL